MNALTGFQQQFFRHPHFVHLNNAGLAPISAVAKDRIKYWAQRFYEEGFYTDADYMTDVFGSRQNIAHLVGCDHSEIAFFTSAGGGINQFAFSCQLSAGDEVLMWEQEYSSHLYPWREACEKSGAKLVLVPTESDYSTPTEKYLAAITPRTKIVAFSWVQFQTGAMMETKELVKSCKEKGILVFVDAMQGLGIIPENIWDYGVDALVGGSHKWLYSPVGVGFLALRKDLVLKLKPHSFGAYTYGTCDDPSDFTCEPKRDATRFEPGSKQVLEITALGASTNMVLETGIRIIHNEAVARAQQLRDGLCTKGFQWISPKNKQYQHPISNFLPPTNLGLAEVTQRLKANNINFAIRGPGLRLSPAAFNTETEIQKIINLF